MLSGKFSNYQIADHSGLFTWIVSILKTLPDEIFMERFNLSNLFPDKNIYEKKKKKRIFSD